MVVIGKFDIQPAGHGMWTYTQVKDVAPRAQAGQVKEPVLTVVRKAMQERLPILQRRGETRVGAQIKD